MVASDDSTINYRLPGSLVY